MIAFKSTRTPSLCLVLIILELGDANMAETQQSALSFKTALY